MKRFLEIQKFSRDLVQEQPIAQNRSLFKTKVRCRLTLRRVYFLQEAYTFIVTSLHVVVLGKIFRAIMETIGTAFSAMSGPKMTTGVKYASFRKIPRAGSDLYLSQIVTFVIRMAIRIPGVIVIAKRFRMRGILVSILFFKMPSSVVKKLS
jgi:hypothetical protein